MVGPETVTPDAGKQLPLQRQQRMSEQMHRRGIPALLVLDPVNILYASGASNMPVFSLRTPARYLLIFAEGPAILFDYRGCAHWPADLAAVDEARVARGNRPRRSRRRRNAGAYRTRHGHL